MELSNPAAERAVLAALFRFGGNAYAESADIITIDSFTIDSNQLIFRCFESIFAQDINRKPDIPLILSTAKELGFKKLIGSKEEHEYLRSISLFPVLQENIRTQCIKLRKLQIIRDGRETLNATKDELVTLTGEEDIEKIVATIEKPILEFTSNLYNNENDELLPVGTNAKEYIEEVINNPGQYTGIPTGFPMYDKTLGGGLPFGGTAIVAARMKEGKSILGNCVGLNIARAGYPILNLDTEMNERIHLNRLLANMSGVPYDNIASGNMTEQEKKKVFMAVAELEKLPYTYKSIKGRKFNEIISVIRRWIIRKVGIQDNGFANPCAVVYDYIKVMDPGELKNMSEHQLMGFEIDAVNNVIGKYNVACLMLAQVNRDGLTREDTGVVGGSDRLAQYCSGLHLLKSKADEERVGTDYNMKLIPLAARLGEPLAPGDYINIKREGKISRMTEGKTRNEIELNKRMPDTGFEIEQDINH